MATPAGFEPAPANGIDIGSMLQEILMLIRVNRLNHSARAPYSMVNQKSKFLKKLYLECTQDA